MSRPILGIDPGPVWSAWVLFNGSRILQSGQLENKYLVSDLQHERFSTSNYFVVIEELESYGAKSLVALGEVIRTAFWSGRFAQAAELYELMPRKKVKRHLVGNIKCGNPQVRAALLNRFGGGFPVNFTDHKFAALAVAVTYWDIYESKRSELDAEIVYR